MTAPLSPTGGRGDGLYTERYYQRADETDDAQFYAWPRKVVHIDDAAIAAVGRLYAEVLPQQARLLDLMTAWRTHLPQGFETAEVVGLGMNSEEMADNPQLTSYLTHDLNQQPTLPFADAEFDGAMCCVSVQYLLHPVLVFHEVWRVLRPGAPFVVTFSNRCFPTKAVAMWQAMDDAQHMALVRGYFEASGPWADVTVEDRSPDEPDANPLFAVWGRKA
jgi:SAM-dependent methyltransferase